MLRFFTNSSSHFINQIKLSQIACSRLFNQKGNFWDKLSISEKINSALCVGYPETAEIAYYKGLGFKHIGVGFEGDAIAAFEQAIDLDKDNKYSEKAKQSIATIKAELERATNTNSANSHFSISKKF